MAKSIGQLLAEADEMIEKNAAATSTKKAAAQPAEESVEVLAERLLKLGGQADTAEDPGLLPKLAHAIAVVDTLLNLPTLAKVAALEEKAREAGHSDEAIAAYFEKNASALPTISCLQLMPWV